MIQKKHRILFDASVLADGPMDGIRRYTHEILKAITPQIQQNYPEWKFYLTVDGVKFWPAESVTQLIENGDLQTLSKIGQKQEGNLISEVSRFANRMKRSVIKRIPFPREQFDLLHLPLPNSYSMFNHFETQVLMTVHDLCHIVCPEFQAKKNIDTLQNGLDFGLQRKAKYITVSHSTAHELQELGGVKPEEIQTVHSACDRNLFRPISDLKEIQRVRQKYNLPSKPYLFSLCTLEPRKNLMGLVKAFRKLNEDDPEQDCQLVLAGRAGWGDQERILKTAASDQVHLIGRVDDADLPVLYSQAMAFACLSYYEGFCLPLLEAMTCGCPVIHSDRSAMPEVAGDASLQADPSDTELIYKRIKEVITDGSLRESMKQRSLQRADVFSWEKAAGEVISMYKKCLSHQAGDSVHIAEKVAA